MKAKPIPLSFKPKTRYVEFKLFPEGLTLEDRDVSFAVNGVLLGFLGQLGFAKANPTVVRYSKGEGVLKCNSDSVSLVRAGLLFLKDVQGIQCSVSCERVSGTLKSLES